MLSASGCTGRTHQSLSASLSLQGPLQGLDLVHPMHAFVFDKEHKERVGGYKKGNGKCPSAPCMDVFTEQEHETTSRQAEASNSSALATKQLKLC